MVLNIEETVAQLGIPDEIPLLRARGGRGVAILEARC